MLSHAAPALPALLVHESFVRRSPAHWDYLKTQSSVILHYLSLAFWPHPLSIDYSDYPIANSLVSVLPQAAVIAALFGLSIWCLRNRPAMGFLGAWFFIVLAPSSSFVPIVTEPAAERRMYLPLIAAVTLVFYGVYELTRRSRMLRARWLALASAGLITVILAAATHRRNSDYRTEITIWSDVVKNHPNYAGARNNLGLALLMEDRHDEGLRHLLESIRLNPRYTKAHQNLGFAYSVLGRHSEAIQHHKEALRYDPNMTHARYQLATEYLETGDSASARNELEILKTQDAKLAGLLAAKLQN